MKPSIRDEKKTHVWKTVFLFSMNCEASSFFLQNSLNTVSRQKIVFTPAKIDFDSVFHIQRFLPEIHKL